MDRLNSAGYVENMEARFVGKHGNIKTGLMSARILNANKVYSEFGKGTTFKILFPALAIEENVVQPYSLSLSDNWRGKGTILLADDEESLRALGAMMLERLRFTVLMAEDGRHSN